MMPAARRPRLCFAAALESRIDHRCIGSFARAVSPVFVGSISEKFQLSRVNHWSKKTKIAAAMVSPTGIRKALLYNHSNLLILFAKLLTDKVALI
jgi:hypothetical protein